mmetsp:Transcript_5663/g.23343  ORF Transcript_5663/g.23343 Transcript_5663/m.23343 type:complete len:204 (-) Transcript_5663:904-1515(-)
MTTPRTRSRRRARRSRCASATDSPTTSARPCCPRRRRDGCEERRWIGFPSTIIMRVSPPILIAIATRPEPPAAPHSRFPILPQPSADPARSPHRVSPPRERVRAPSAPPAPPPAAGAPPTSQMSSPPTQPPRLSAPLRPPPPRPRASPQRVWRARAGEWRPPPSPRGRWRWDPEGVPRRRRRRQPPPAPVPYGSSAWKYRRLF